MKTNHIPTEFRLERHIHKLQSMINFGNYWTSQKFYPKCRFCGITNVECNTTVEDRKFGEHRKGCKVNGVEKEIAHYTYLLEQLE